MNLAQSTVAPDAPSTSQIRSRYWARGMVLAASLVALGALAIVVAAIPKQLALPIVCRASQPCTSLQLSPQAAAVLSQVGISAHRFLLLTIGVNTLAALTWFAAGGVLLWRASTDRVALVFALQAFTQGVSNAASYFDDPRHDGLWFILAAAYGAAGTITVFYAFALFPNGRFVPRWLRWVGFAWIVAVVVSLWAGGLFAGLLSIAELVSLGGCQVYRFWKVSSAVERQQTKVVVFAFVSIISVLVVALLPVVMVPQLGDAGSLYTNVMGNVLTLVLLLGPISIVVAILRYRLFDIDLIINRTLVYGSLTALLAGVYFGSVLVMQHMAVALAGPQAGANPLILVVSTLLIAALFQPLRVRIQRTIDRRFYRQKYDATKTLAQFAATLRGEVDLAELQEHLVGVVEETLQPEHVSLWIAQQAPSLRHT